ncbi:DNA polymerase III subunit beta [Spirosoma litoris]
MSTATIDEQIQEVKEQLKKAPVLTAEFIVSSSILLRHVKSILPIIATNPIVPILENILFDVNKESVLTLIASDLQKTILCNFPVELIGEKPTTAPVRFCVNARRLYKILSRLPEQPITISFDGDSKVVLQSESGNYKYFSENPLDFPKLPTISEGRNFTIHGDVLRNALLKTIPFTSNDDLRPAMTGVYFHDNCVVSTDGHRLIRIRVPELIVNTPFIIHSSACSLFLKAYNKNNCNVEVSHSLANIRFAFANYVVYSRLIDERFPDYQNAIPEGATNTATVSRTALINLIGRALVFANPTTHQIKFTIAANKLIVTAEQSDQNESSSESLSVKSEGEIIIGYNGNYLQEVLKHIEGSHVRFEIISPNRLTVIYATDGEINQEHFSSVMPVMLYEY